MVEGDRIVRDWRGRAIRLLDFEELIINRDEVTELIGARLLDVFDRVFSCELILHIAFFSIFAHAEVTQGNFTHVLKRLCPISWYNVFCHFLQKL